MVLALFHLFGNQSFSNKCTITFGVLFMLYTLKINYVLNFDKFFIVKKKNYETMSEFISILSFFFVAL